LAFSNGKKTLSVDSWKSTAPVTEEIAIKNRKEQPAVQNAADGGNPN